MIRPNGAEASRLSSLLAPRGPANLESPWQPVRRIGEPVAFRRAVRKVDQAYPDIEPDLNEEDREQLVRELDRRQRTGDWRGYTWADLQRAARALLQPERNALRSRLAGRRFGFGRSEGSLHERREYRHLVPFLLAQVDKEAKPRFLRTMYRLYLSTFDRRSLLTRQLADRLDGCVQHTALPIQRAVELGILDPRTAAGNIVARMASEASPFDFIKDIGIEAPHGEGLMTEVHQQFVRHHTAARLRRDQAASRRLLNWVAPPKGQSMEAGAELAIDALLAPWQRSDPDKELRKRLEADLVRAFGDPRLNRAGVWTRCSTPTRAVVMRWLAGETIDVFFEIISKAVTSHMWADRRGLWMDLYQAGRITEAWFALSRRGEEMARSLRRTRGVALGYARNDSWSSGDKDKCLLLMRINGRVVVEGSHSFKTHIYPRGDDDLFVGGEGRYPTTYNCDEIRNHGRSGRAAAFMHHQAWERRVRAELAG